MFIHDISLQNYILLVKSDTLNLVLMKLEIFMQDYAQRSVRNLQRCILADLFGLWFTAFLTLSNYERYGLFQTFCKFTLNQYFWTFLLICNCSVIWHITVSKNTKMGSQ